MSYADTIKRSWNDNRLMSVLLELTYACNLDCTFCYNDLHRSTGSPFRYTSTASFSMTSPRSGCSTSPCLAASRSPTRTSSTSRLTLGV